jgi:GNAT superfamily N-acetyltransferase
MTPMNGQQITGSRIIIRPFQPRDQEQVQALILAGLAEHWGKVDPALNPDLLAIGQSYAQELFLVADCQGQIVGTGALVRQQGEQAEIVRMTIAAGMRRQGLGTRILEALCREARRRGVQQLMLETTADWPDAISFYSRFGFQLTHFRDGDFGREAHFMLLL